jgi:hypothetical protein
MADDGDSFALRNVQPLDLQQRTAGCGASQPIQRNTGWRFHNSA